jgi:hypothetical protein
MLLPNNKVPQWGAAYSLAEELSGISQDHPPSVFIQNSDDTTAPPQGTLAYAQKLLAIKAPKPVIHMCAHRSLCLPPTDQSSTRSGSRGRPLHPFLLSFFLSVICRRYPKGGHGFGLCQGESEWLEVCDWPKAAQRFLQDLGMAKGWPATPADAEPTQPCVSC